jgi:hypothetical protein
VPLLIVVAAALALGLAVVLALPFSLVMRYRAGRARRQARGWAASLNVAMLLLSIALFLGAAAMTTLWAADALRYALAGLAGGMLLGTAGLLLTRWETSPRALHFTPNAWLVLLVTVVVAARLAYGLWRTGLALMTGLDHTSEVVASGVQGSFAAGGIVLGYYLAFSIGVLRRVRRHQRHAAASIGARPAGPTGRARRA